MLCYAMLYLPPLIASDSIGWCCYTAVILSNSVPLYLSMYVCFTQLQSRFGVVVNALVSINEIHLRRARLVLEWVTVSGVQSPVRGKSISVYNQTPRSTQPGHPSVGRHNEYQPKGGDALQLGSKGRYGL